MVAGVVRAVLPADEFTLSWQHSVEKTRWEEVYRIDGDRLLLTGARIQGFGAGMEPPAGAVLRNGWWTWTPAPLRLAALPLTQSSYTADWTLCWKDRCRALAALAPPATEGSVVDLVACDPANATSLKRGQAAACSAGSRRERLCRALTCSGKAPSLRSRK
jgi:hypothetical protein